MSKFRLSTSILLLTFFLSYPIMCLAQQTKHFVVNNNTGDLQYVLFHYNYGLYKEYGDLFILKPEEKMDVYYPTCAKDKSIQLLHSSTQYKVTANKQYNLGSITNQQNNAEDTIIQIRQSPHQDASWGTIFLRNDTLNRKAVQFRFGSTIYNIFLNENESISVPYSKPFSDGPICKKTMHVLGTSKKTTVHDKENILVSTLLK